MKAEDIANLALAGELEVFLSLEQMEELIADLMQHTRYGRPVPPPFFLLNVWVMVKGETRRRPASGISL
jgi:hypothetical protein